MRLVLCGWLGACSAHADESGPAMQPHTADADAATAHRMPAASVVRASQTPSESLDTQADAGAAAIAGRSFLAEYLINARDLGGIRLPGPSRVVFGRLFRGPLLASLPNGRCTTFTDTGVRTVIDLRVPSEAAKNPEPACIGEHALIVLAPFPIPPVANATGYIAMLDERASISAFFSVLADPTAYPIYFHCTLGRDRTGVVAALVLLALGATRRGIRQDYLLSSQTGGISPEPIEAMLDEIEIRGGIQVYLSSVGVSPELLEPLRRAATEPLP
jgi:protein-tyrosine phosphatase